MVPVLAMVIEQTDMAYETFNPPMQLVEMFYQELQAIFAIRLVPLLTNPTLLMLAWLDEESKDFYFWSTATERLTSILMNDAREMAMARTKECLMEVPAVARRPVRPAKHEEMKNAVHEVQMRIRGGTLPVSSSDSVLQPWIDKDNNMVQKRKQRGMSIHGLETWMSLGLTAEFRPFAEIIRKYACVPATSVMCEEIFLGRWQSSNSSTQSRF